MVGVFQLVILVFLPFHHVFLWKMGVYYTNMSFSFHFSGHKISTGFQWISMGDSKR